MRVRILHAVGFAGPRQLLASEDLRQSSACRRIEAMERLRSLSEAVAHCGAGDNTTALRYQVELGDGANAKTLSVFDDDVRYNPAVRHVQALLRLLRLT